MNQEACKHKNQHFFLPPTNAAKEDCQKQEIDDEEVSVGEVPETKIPIEVLDAERVTLFQKKAPIIIDGEVIKKDELKTFNITIFKDIKTPEDASKSKQGTTIETDMCRLRDIICRLAWSPSIFANNIRTSKTFISAIIIGFDYDGVHDAEGNIVSELKLERAQEIFSSYNCIIATTKSHQKEKKSGKVTKKPCDRFRVIVLLDRTITTVDDFKLFSEGFNAHILELEPNAISDEQVNGDSARFFFSSQTLIYSSLGKTVDVEYFINKGRNIDKEIAHKSKMEQAPKSKKQNDQNSDPLINSLKSTIKCSVVADLYGVKKASCNKHAPCFLCGNDNNNPSLQINDNFCYCHRCEKTIDIIGIVQYFERCGLAQALNILIEIKNRSYINNDTTIPKDDGRNTARIRKLQEKQLKIYNELCCNLRTSNPENQGLYKRATESLIFEDLTTKGNTFLVSLDKAEITSVNIDILIMIFPPSFKIGKSNINPFNEYIKGARHIALYKYLPFNNEIVLKESEVTILNTYEPPFWQKENFISGTPIPLETTLPEIYEEFFRYFTGNDDGSFEYFLDWLATAIQAKNQTYLITVGIEGNGKGTVAEILEVLFGQKNFVKVRDTILKEKFNGPLHNKRMVYIDEVWLKTKEQVDRLKDLVNRCIEVELKGKDAITADNYASFYISSNEMACLPVSRESRRYSIIQLSDKKMVDVFDIDDTRSELFNNENLTKLAYYLHTRPVSRNMLLPFKSRRFEKMLEANCKEWEKYVVFEAERREKIPLKVLQDEISRVCNMERGPGRDKLRDLASRFPNRLKVWGANDSPFVALIEQENEFDS